MDPTWTVVAYRRICGNIDRNGVPLGHFEPKRFNVHTNLDERVARIYFNTYAMSPQTLAVEMYGPDDQRERFDALINLIRDGNEDPLSWYRACNQPTEREDVLP